VQYAAALFQDGAYAMPPNAVSGVTSRRAKAGDVITLYGVGFGPVTPAVAAGQIAPAQLTSMNGTLQFSIGGVQLTASQVQYAGLVAGQVGLYQFNLVVPSVAPGDSVPVTFTLNGTAGAQTLYIAVQ
jgi:uncharacterized protein (TIGR03437 family)